MSLESLFNRAWYGKSKWTHVFMPLQPLVSYLVNKKRENHLAKQSSTPQIALPVIVVGNISVGGTGKSPMVIALVKVLKTAGYHPGIVSRGYGVSAKVPIKVTASSSASECGDEPVMLAKRASCSVVICQDRLAAAQVLVNDQEVDLIISDDGMQHYGMDRDIEFLMLDGKRGLGNGYLLPVGPLREPVSRLLEVDFVASVVASNDEQALLKEKDGLKALFKGYKDFSHGSKVIDKLITLPLQATGLINVKTGEKGSLDLLKSFVSCQLVAGIGNPERFLNTLLDAGLAQGYSTHWYNDHHQFTEADIHSHFPVIMTEKDAVKCKDLNLVNENVWYLPVEVSIPPSCVESLLNKLRAIAVKKSLGK
ncbi:tetraacyldisaccharide 4'-kinase [Marinomonas sp. MED121]|uniref:tetraacyldisaccharide 4'-kinase n=1 Tax=Marinomonas sp. MED121 TaxID=314277 RepID=UPI0002F1C4AB|nr:tetraacyldisaccharide 4'-kinase [Marinomonas sp. MED121]